MQTLRPKFTLALFAVGLVAGCGSLAGEEPKTVEAQHATVVPEFHLEETDSIPDRLQLDRLGLVISEIQLTPADGTHGVAYATSSAFSATFDVADGETRSRGESIELPETGKFDVKLRLAPASATSQETPYSFQMAGYVVGERGEMADGTQDGDPIPAPFVPGGDDDGEDGTVDDAEENPEQWTPFRYRSENSVVYTLDSVEIESGEQYLSFSFDTAEWAYEVVDPLSDAVGNALAPLPRREDSEKKEPVDVTEEIDQRGDGPRAAAGHMSVEAVRHTGNAGGR